MDNPNQKLHESSLRRLNGRDRVLRRRLPRRLLLSVAVGIAAISVAQGCAAIVGGAAGAGAGYIAGHEAADDD